MQNNIKLVRDYINGDEIEGYSIEQLEDDPGFMKSVILVSGDKNIYNLCSDNVKSNYDFVYFLVDFFVNDTNYIINVVDEFLKYDISEYDKTGILVKMCNIFEKSQNQLAYFKYRAPFVFHFMSLMIDNIQFKLSHPEIEGFGLGFFVFQDEYAGDDDIIKAYAKELIKYIFEELKVNLEEQMHISAKSVDEIKSGGIKNYMINFLRMYDIYLADYASIHTDILSLFETKVNKVIRNWDTYGIRREEKKLDNMFNRVHEYMDEHEYESSISEEDFIYFIGCELGVSERLAKSYDMSLEDYHYLYSPVNEEVIKAISSRLKDRSIYTNIKKIMQEELLGEEPSKNETEKGSGKIIQLDLKKFKI